MTIEEAAREAFKNALENEQDFDWWTAEMLANDMIAFDADVGELCHKPSDMQELIRVCDLILKDGIKQRPFAFKLPILARGIANLNVKLEIAIQATKDAKLDDETAGHFIIEAMPYSTLVSRVLDVALSEFRGMLGMVVIAGMSQSEMRAMVRDLRDEMHNALAKGDEDAIAFINKMKEVDPSEGADTKQEN